MSQTNILILFKVIKLFSALKQCFLTLHNSVFYPHSGFRYFLSFSQHIVITSLNPTKPSVFVLKQQCVHYQVGTGGGKVSLKETINC